LVFEETFPNSWIGRDGPTPWPPRSPDITPFDFFLCGYVNSLNAELNPICHLLALLGVHNFLNVSRIRVKDKVFSTPVPDITNLKARITDAFATVTEDMLENT